MHADELELLGTEPCPLCDEILESPRDKKMGQHTDCYQKNHATKKENQAICWTTEDSDFHSQQFCPITNFRTDSRAHPACCPLGAGGDFYGVKVVGYSPLFSADSMNECNYALTPLHMSEL